MRLRNSLSRIGITFGFGIFIFFVSGVSAAATLNDSVQSTPADSISAEVSLPRLGETEQTLTLQLQRWDFRSPVGGEFKVLLAKNGVDPSGWDTWIPATHRTYIGTVAERDDAFAVAYRSRDGSLKSVVFAGRGVTWFFNDGQLTRAMGRLDDHDDLEWQIPQAMSLNKEAMGHLMYDFGVAYDMDIGPVDDLQEGSDLLPHEAAYESIEFTHLLQAATYMTNALVRPVMTQVIIRTDAASSPYAALPSGNNRLQAAKADWQAHHDAALADAFKVAVVINNHPVGGSAELGGIFSTQNMDDDKVFNTFYNELRHEMGHNWGVDEHDAGVYDSTLMRFLPSEGKTVMNGNRYYQFAGPALMDMVNHRDTELAGESGYTFSATTLPPRAVLDVETLIAGFTHELDVLANDFDPNGDFDPNAVNSVVVDARSAAGVPLTVNQNNKITYQPNPNMSLPFDYFHYVIADGAGLTSQGTVMVRVLTTSWDFTDVDIDKSDRARGRARGCRTCAADGGAVVEANGGWVEWHISAPEAGNYNVSLQYAAQDSAVPVDLQVNDGGSTRLTLDGPHSGSDYLWTLNKEVTLNAGDNRIRVSGAAAADTDGEFIMKTLRLAGSFDPYAQTLPPYFTADPIEIPRALVGDAINFEKFLQRYVVNPTLASSSVGVGYTFRVSASTPSSWLSVNSDGSILGTPEGTHKGVNALTVELLESDGAVVDDSTLRILVDGVADSSRYEAEAATLSAVEVAPGPVGSSGNEIADFLEKGADTYIEFNITNPSSGNVEAELVFTYYHGARKDRPLVLSVNDMVAVERLSFPPTGGWDVAGATLPKRVWLKGGGMPNTVKIAATEDKSGANIDYLTVNIIEPAVSIIDADMDGVADDDDQCPDTPMVPNVDDDGCPFENDAPSADDVWIDLSETEFASIRLAGRDPNGDMLTYRLLDQPTFGSAVLSGDTVTYTHSTESAFSDSFRYTVSDGTETSEPARVRLLVDTVNDPPVVSDSLVVVAPTEGITVAFNVTDVDSSDLTYQIVTAPEHGTLGEISNGTVTYTSTSDLPVLDQFQFTVTDGLAALQTGTVDIQVAENLAPTYGTAKQGSQWTFYAPERAIDGDLSTFQHTQCNARDNWWQVRLPDNTDIYAVHVTVRGDSNPAYQAEFLERINDSSVYVSRQSYRDGLDGARVIGTLGKTLEKQQFNVPRESGEAEYVIIKAVSDCLHVVEVEVLGALAPEPYFEPFRDTFLVPFNASQGTEIGQFLSSDYQGDSLTYSIPAGSPFSIDNDGVLRVSGEVPDQGRSFDVVITVSDGENTSSITVTVNTTAKEAVANALQSGRVDQITKQELYQAIFSVIDAYRTAYNPVIAELFNLNSDGTAKSDGSSLTAVAWDPTKDSGVLGETFGVNKGFLTANKGGSNPLGVLGAAPSRFVALSGSPSRTPRNEQMNQLLKNAIGWLTDGKSQSGNFHVAMAHLSQDYWFKDESNNRKWLTENYGDAVSFNAANACEKDALEACLQSADLLLVSGDGGYDDERDDALADMIMASGVPVLYIHLYQNLSPLARALLDRMQIKWEGSNYWSRMRTEDFDPRNTVFNDVPSNIEKIRVALENLMRQAYQAEVGCDPENCLKKSQYGSDIDDARSAVSAILASLDRAKIRIFDEVQQDPDKYVFERLLALLGDKLREEIRYPMDRVKTDPNVFWEAYFAEATHYHSRHIVPVQPDLGNFSRTNFDHVTPTEQKTIQLESKHRFRSAGVYAIPGEVVTVTLSENSETSVGLFINTQRSGSTHVWDSNGYKRPIFLRSVTVNLDPGETWSFASAHGGPIQIEFPGNTNGDQVELIFENVGEHPHWRGPEDDTRFAAAMEAGAYDWAELVTPSFEVHSTLENMRSTLRSTRWPSPSELAQGAMTHSHSAVRLVAGKQGPGIEVIPEIHDWAAERGWQVTGYDSVQHMNADQATCGFGCSGNPYDAYWSWSPLGHGDLHEIGHGLEQGKFRFKGWEGHSTTNPYSYYSKSRYNLSQGVDGTSCQNLPFEDTFGHLVVAAESADPVAYLQEAFWPNTNSSEQVLNTVQLFMAAQRAGVVENGWHVLARLHIYLDNFQKAERFDEEDWLTVRDSFGYSNFSQSERDNLKRNDWLLIAYSTVTGLNYSKLIQAWGHKLSPEAIEQVEAYGYPEVPVEFFVSQGGEYCQWRKNGDFLDKPTLPISAGKQFPSKEDTDKDGYWDVYDAFADNPLEWADSDNNGVGDNAQAGNSAPIGSVTISGDEIEGARLTASNTLEDADGLGEISYQWHRGGIDIIGATSNIYALQSADVGGQLSVTASYVDGKGVTHSKTSDTTGVIREFILTDGTQAKVAIEAVDFFAEEGAETAAFKVTRSYDSGARLNESLDVSFTISGSATESDLRNFRTVAHFEPEQPSVVIVVNPVADDVDEAPELLTVTLLDGTWHDVIDGSDQASVTIRDANYVEEGVVAPLYDTFDLTSLPDAKRTIYLNFNNTVDSDIGPYDTDGKTDGTDPFSEAEHGAIQEIWASVAEDFGPFKVNVTTKTPAEGAVTNSGPPDDTWGVTILIGKPVGDFGLSESAGGAFAASDDRPGKVSIGAQQPYRSTAEVAASVVQVIGESLGFGAREESSSRQSRMEDSLGVRSDDHSNDPRWATPLVPLDDGYETLFAEGVVETNDDVDWFVVQHSGGDLILNVMPNPIAPNLNVRFELYDSDANPIDEEPIAVGIHDAGAARYSAPLPAGAYRLNVASRAEGDLGAYTIDVGLSVLAAYDPSGVTSADDAIEGSSQFSSVTVSSLLASNLGQEASTNEWPLYWSAAASHNGSEYMSFTIEPPVGSAVVANTLDASFKVESEANLSIRYSLDDFASVVDAVALQAGHDAVRLQLGDVPVTATSLEFRLYMTSASAVSGYRRLTGSAYSDSGMSGQGMVLMGRVIPASASPEGAVIISGTPIEDGTLTASHTLTDADGMGEVRYQWLRDGVAVIATGANDDTYTLGQLDVSAVMTVQASYTDGRGHHETVASVGTTRVENVNDSPTGELTFEEIAENTYQASHTINDEDGMGALSYQWLRDGIAIEGATGDTYVLSSADIGGAQLSLRVTFTDLQGSNELVDSTTVITRDSISLPDTSGEDTDDDGIMNVDDPDDDNDGLFDDEEEALGTNPLLSDSDNDGLSDREERDLGTNPLRVDSDGDGLSDREERDLGTNPLRVDSDGDGVVDSEDAFPNDPSETTDTDADGVGDNADAFPNDPNETLDSDGDGVGDNTDVFPNDASETLDTDGDGVGDNADVFPDDDSETTDTDGDGVGNDADTDDDGDGYSDSAEIEAGTDPLSSESIPSEDEEGSGGLPIWMLYIATQPKAA